jgi:hypothetical protein
MLHPSVDRVSNFARVMVGSAFGRSACDFMIEHIELLRKRQGGEWGLGSVTAC